MATIDPEPKKSLSDLHFPVVLYSPKTVFAMRRLGVQELHWPPAPGEGDPFRLVDHSGNRYVVQSWKRGPPPSAWLWQLLAFFGLKFYQPELIYEDTVSPRGLAVEVGEIAIRNDLIGNSWGDRAEDLRAAINQVNDYEAAFAIAASVCINFPG